VRVPRVRFRVRGWLEREDYETLTNIAKYVGRGVGYSIFELDPERIEKNGLGPDDVLAIISSIDKIDEEDRERLIEIIRDAKKVKIEIGPDGWLRIRSRIYLKPIIAELGVTLPYSKDEKAYKAPPHMYASLVKLFRSKGLVVEDDLGLFPPEASLPRRISFRGQLRPYQEEALRAWKDNDYRGIIVLPTGAGKTIVGIAALAELNVRTLIVVVTKEQVKQWIDAIRKFTDAGALVGAYYSDEKRLSPITVTTYQTAYRKVKEFTKHFSLLILDEAHHLPADKFRTIATYMAAPFRMGLSATIEREDGRHVEIFPLLGGVVYHATPGDLTRQGYLAPYTIRTRKVQLSPAEKKRYDELRRQYQRLAAGRTFQEVLAAAKRGDERAIEAVRIHHKMKEIVQYSSAKLDEAEKIIREELAKGSKIIVFTQYKRQAEELASRVGGLLLHGGIPKSRRTAVLERFRRMKSGVLVVTTVGDEGLDIPDANVGVFVSGTGSPRQFVQRLGRLLRPKEDGKSAVLYEIVMAGTSEEYQSRKRRMLRRG